jgi:hypothetical protein
MPHAPLEPDDYLGMKRDRRALLAYLITHAPWKNVAVQAPRKEESRPDTTRQDKT